MHLIQKKQINIILDILLIIPVYWIIYAIPHFPNRVPLPSPFPDNTALSTTIIGISISYMISSILLRKTDPFYRLLLPPTLLLTAIIFYEFFHYSFYHMNRLLLSKPFIFYDQNYHMRLFMASIIGNLLIFVQNFMHKQTYKFSLLSSPNFGLLAIFLITTIILKLIGFYSTIKDNPINAIHKLSFMLIYACNATMRDQI